MSRLRWPDLTNSVSDDPGTYGSVAERLLRMALISCPKGHVRSLAYGLLQHEHNSRNLDVCLAARRSRQPLLSSRPKNSPRSGRGSWNSMQQNGTHSSSRMCQPAG